MREIALKFSIHPTVANKISQRNLGSQFCYQNISSHHSITHTLSLSLFFSLSLSFSLFLSLSFSLFLSLFLSVSPSGAKFKLSPGVEVNATAMLKSAQELSPIAGLLPKEAKLRKKWTIEFYVKANSNWDCSWDKEVRRWDGR